MTPIEAAELLKQFNEWRRYDGEPFDENQPTMPNPKQIGIALDVAIEFIQQAQQENKNNQGNHTMNTAIIEWLANGHTGVSSKNIAFYLGFGIKPKSDAYFSPSDPSDFNRCLLLLELAPELREKLTEMSVLSKHWARIVEKWDEVEAAFIDEVGRDWCKAKSAPKTYKLMKEIYCGAF